jgi:hypothetical protein
MITATGAFGLVLGFAHEEEEEEEEECVILTLALGSASSILLMMAYPSSVVLNLIGITTTVSSTCSGLCFIPYSNYIILLLQRWYISCYMAVSSFAF